MAASMGKSHGLFFLLLLSSTLLAPTSASRPALHDGQQSHSLSSSPSPPPPASASAPGPILTEGKNYTRVCDPARFTALGLDMADFAYCDKSLPYDVRVKDLVSSMTLAEKVGQLGDRAQGADRIGLPKYGWWSEALHGVAYVGHATYFGDIVPGATSFPNVIVSAASFNASLWNAIGQVVSTEARAMYNLGHTGLTFWSPNINVVRDPRWGRILETPGEDPFTVGRYAVEFVRGLQDVKGHETASDLNTRPLKVSSCCKHYAAYDLEDWQGVDRYIFDARVREQDMKETFLRPFEMCVKDGDVSSVMCSFNKVNGIPTCADPKLLSQTIRGDWALHGYIVSDCDSIDVIIKNQKWLQDTPEDAVSQALRAGLDLDCGTYYTDYTQSAIQQGQVGQRDVDKALTNLYMVLMRLGYFDGMPMYDALDTRDICTPENLELAADAARQGIVLLKNNATLPLNRRSLRRIALVGPHANATRAMIGNYEGEPCRLPSPLDVLSADVDVVDYQPGCVDVHCNDANQIFPAVRAAKKADATFIFAGLDLSVEAETRDRNDLLLPGYQTQLINQVAEAAAGPVVLVILSGGCLDISFARDNPNIDAIIWAGYPGAEGARAVSDIIFGRHNPSGRLPITWYQSDYTNMLPMTSMPLRPNDTMGYPGRTYKFFNGTTVYPFGYGLSYTQFDYKLKSAINSVKVKLASRQHCKSLPYQADAYVPPCPAVVIDDTPCMEKVEFQVQVSNIGKRDGSEVVMVYSKPPADILGTHIKQLVAFERVFVPAGESRTVKFSVPACKMLGIVEETGYSVLPAGKHTVEVGSGDGAVSFPVHVYF